MIDYPNKLDKIFDKLDIIGATPIIIGGYIRDKLLGISSKDIDIEVYNIASYEELEKNLAEFGKVNSVGKSFGVCKLTLEELEVDFTLPRVDTKTASGHTGFNVMIKDNIDFYHATLRRDFTINSIGYDVKRKKILDPFDGIKDLQSQILKATSGNTFIDDPLRALRAIQFSARFNLRPDIQLQSLIQDMMRKKLLQEISKERVFIEFKKLLLQSQKPSIGFTLLYKLNIVDYFWELKQIYKMGKYQKLLEAIDVMVLNKTGNDNEDIVLMFSVISSYIRDMEDVKRFLYRFSNDKKFIANVLKLQTYKEINEKDFTPYTLSTLAVNIKLTTLFTFLSVIHHKDITLLESLESAKELSSQLNILEESIPKILKGKDLLDYGLAPSKEFSTILDQAYDAQLKGAFTTHKEALTWLSKNLTL